MNRFLFMLVTIMLCASVTAQNTADLKLNLEKNKVYRLKSVSEQTVTQTMNGVQQTTESNVIYTVSLKMIDSTPDFMITEVRFDTLVSNSNAMGKMVSINSAVEGDIKSAETSGVLSFFQNRLSKNALYVKMDFTGRPFEIVNLKMLSDIILKDTSSITLTGPTAEAVKQQAVNMVGENDLKTMIEMFTYCLPGKQVSKGDDWSVTQKMNSGGMMLDIITTYHLDGIKDNYADITAESVIQAAVNAEPIKSGPATVTYGDLKGLTRSDMVIDVRSGLVVESKGKTQISGNLGVSGPGFNMQIPLDIKGESKVVSL